MASSLKAVLLEARGEIDGCLFRGLRCCLPISLSASWDDVESIVAPKNQLSIFVQVVIELRSEARTHILTWTQVCPIRVVLLWNPTFYADSPIPRDVRDKMNEIQSLRELCDHNIMSAQKYNEEQSYSHHLELEAQKCPKAHNPNLFQCRLLCGQHYQSHEWMMML